MSTCSEKRNHLINRLIAHRLVAVLARGRAWALWKALIVIANLTQANAVESAQSTRLITEILEDYKRNR